MPDALTVAVDVARRLDAASIPYAIGGALALGVHGVPRATADVDLNVFVEPPHLPAVIDLLARAGARVDADVASKDAREQGMFLAWLGGVRLDVFVPSIDYAWEAAKTRVQVEVAGIPVYFLSVEALCVFKLLFFRPKDLLDLEKLVEVNESLDRAAVHASVASMMGEDDERIRAWDSMSRRPKP